MEDIEIFSNGKMVFPASEVFPKGVVLDMFDCTGRLIIIMMVVVVGDRRGTREDFHHR